LAPQSFETLRDDVADAVLKEIMSHIDPRILQFMEPDLCQFEDYRSRGSKDSLEDWYTPKSPAERWQRVFEFKALASISDRLVGAFERIKDDPQIMSMASAHLDQDCGFVLRRMMKR
jgi:hypothetical protein